CFLTRSALSTTPASLFSVYGDLRDLHSFPTRRSSDLLCRADWTCLPCCSAPIPWPDPPNPKARPGGRSCVGGQSLSLSAISNQRDRKSTRLNSSHVKISYAVFCLKKKTKTKYKDRQQE